MGWGYSTAELMYGFLMPAGRRICMQSIEALEYAHLFKSTLREGYRWTNKGIKIDQVVGVFVDEGAFLSGVTKGTLQPEQVATVEVLHRALKAVGEDVRSHGFYAVLSSCDEAYPTVEKVIKLDEALQETEEGKALLQELNIKLEPELE